MPDGNMMIPTQRREALIRADSVDEKARTVEVIWTTGAKVRKRRFLSGEIEEELVVTPLAVRLDRINTGAPFLNAHNSFELSAVIGVVVEGSARIAGGQGTATIRFSERAEVEPIFRDIADGIIRNISVGYRVHKYEIEKRDGAPELWRAVDWEPLEISAVPIGADPGAQVRSDSAETYPVAITRRDATAGAPAILKGLTMPDGINAPAQSPDEIRAAERRRVNLAHDFAKRHELGDEWAQRMIEREIPEEHIREAALKLIKIRTNADCLGGGNMAPDLLGERGRSEPLEQFFHARIEGRAVPNHVASEIGGRRFTDAARYFLRTCGQSVSAMNDQRIIGHAMESRTHQGAGDFPMLLENAMHKVLLARTQREPSGIRRVAFKGSASDFRPQNRYRGGSFPKLQKYSEHGEITTGHLADGKREKLQLESMGSIVRITRQALVNDDLGALSDFAREAAEGIETTINSQLAAIVEANPLMSDGQPALSVAHGNILTGGPVLSETSLKDAKLAMRKQSDINGERAGIAPKYLLVPAELEITAQKLLASINATKTSDVNPHTDLELVVESRFASTSLWYLVADPAAVRGIEYAFLDGQEAGMVEVKSGWETDGLEVRSTLDLGVAFIDPRGWVAGG